MASSRQRFALSLIRTTSRSAIHVPPASKAVYGLVITIHPMTAPVRVPVTHRGPENRPRPRAALLPRSETPNAITRNVPAIAVPLR